MFAERAGVVDLGLERQLAVTVLAARRAQVGGSGVGRVAGVAVIARLVDIVVGQLVHERRERTVDGRVDAVVEGRHARCAQALGDEVEVLVDGQRRGEVAAELVAVAAAQLGVGVGEEAAVPGVVGSEAHERVRFLAGQRRGEFAGHAGHGVGEEVRDALDRGVAVVQLGVHLQRYAGGLGGVGRDIGLEQVFLGVDVGVEFRGFGLAHDAVLVVDRGVEEVVDLLGSARHVEVEVLVEGAVLEQHVVPVDVGVDVGVESQFGSHDLLVAVIGLFAARGAGLVEGLHVGDAVGDLRNAGRGRGAELGAQVDGHFLRVAAVFRGDDHHAVGSARTVEGRGRGVLEHRERLDGLGRDVVEHLVGDFHAVEDQQRRLSRSEGRDSADPEIGAVGARLARFLHGDHAGDLAAERGREVARRGLQVARLDRLHGAHERLFLLHAEADHHHVFEFVRSVGQRDEFEEVDVPDGNFLGVVAQERNGDRLGRSGHGQFVVAAGVGGRADVRALNIDVGSDDGLVVGRGDDRSGDGHLPVRGRRGGDRRAPGDSDQFPPPFDGIAQRFVEHRVEHGLKRRVLERCRDRPADVDVLVFEEDRVAGLPLHLFQHRFQRNAPEGFGDGLRVEGDCQQQARDQRCNLLE